MNNNMKALFNFYHRALSLIAIIIGLYSVPATAFEFQHYPQARILYKTSLTTNDYQLALSSYAKVGGVWQRDRVIQLAGNVTRYTLELPSGHSYEEGFDFYLKQIKELLPRELYHCEGRDCGTSNSWANNHFKVIQLYGSDQSQRYAAYEFSPEEGSAYYLSLYSVKRGNNRVYVQVEVIQSAKIEANTIAASPETIVRALTNEGFYRLPDPLVMQIAQNKRVDADSAHLKMLVALLNEYPKWKIAVVGHEYLGANNELRHSRSLELAQNLVAAVISAGISGDRVTAYGLGALAPAGREGRSQRIEVVKLSD